MGCFCLQSISDSVQPHSAPLAHLLFPFPVLFPALFPAALGSGLQHGLQCLPTELRFKVPQNTLHAAFNIVQNNSEDTYAMLMVHRKKTLLKGFPQNQLTTKTETDRDVLPIYSFSLQFFFCPLQWSCFVLSLIQNPQKLMKTFSIAFQKLQTRPLMKMNTCFSYRIYSH